MTDTILADRIRREAAEGGADPYVGPVTPFSLKDAPAFIEVLFPAQKISVEAFKEQMAVHGKTLTALGSYWKGRKPLILNKACILGALLPVTSNLRRDLEIFEMLMAMDDLSFAVRFERIPPADLLAKLTLRVEDYFDVEPADSLPETGPFDIADYVYQVNGRDKWPTLTWKTDVPEKTRRKLEAQALPFAHYRERVANAKRPESCPDVHDHIWEEVNEHLGTQAYSMPELVEQLGVMRFGHRPRVADTFSGSGQIPFEAARLGCDTYASDLNPISCMLTWGAFNVVGAAQTKRAELLEAQSALVARVQAEVDRLGVELADGWRAKVFLYCVEVTCPQTGWTVPLLPTLVVSKGYKVVARLVPDSKRKRYDIELVQSATAAQLKHAEIGTIQDSHLVHEVDGVAYRTKISTLRGDYTAEDGTTKNRLRLWEKSDVVFREDDIYRERLYAIQWQKLALQANGREKTLSEFRAVTDADLAREQTVQAYVQAHLDEWQAKGYLPDTVIEKGEETERLYKERGWTHWHHLFNPRQLLLAGLVNQFSGAELKYGLAQVLNNNCRCSRWHNGGGGGGLTVGIFDNQAMNTLYNYGCRGSDYASSFLLQSYKSFPLPEGIRLSVASRPAREVNTVNDIYITDPPYGDAVKYEEILEFFIAWLRKNPPEAFADWVWDSRRALAVKGEDHDFKLGMVAAYKRMAEMMPDNGIQVLMFTHQSGAIWADIANIVWASGLQVSAAWYVVTETDSALREGSYVKGTVLLVLRKRQGRLGTFRDDLALELRDEVEAQVATLTGLNQSTKDLYRDENLFADADLQMAGYAAALRVLTRYAEIDGVDMTVEALRPRERGAQTRVDALIGHAVEIANQCLIPSGISENHWNRLRPIERYYLKMLDLESHQAHSLDNFQNFARAFKVQNHHALMASVRANQARLKSSVEFGRAEMAGESELADTPLRAVLYALMELDRGAESDDVLGHLGDNVTDYFQKRELVAAIADFMASRLPTIREDEASHARVLRDLVLNERLA